MLNQLLLPNRFKSVGWWILLPAAITGIIISATSYEANWLHVKTFTIYGAEIFGEGKWFQLVEVNLTNTIIGVCLIIGALLVGFSREKQEDEFIANIRLSSLLWAVCVNYILLLITFIFIYGLVFFTVMMYNMFTVLIIFIVRFNFILYKNTKNVSDEKYN